MYDTSLKRKWDNKAVLDYAIDEAVKEAKTEAKREEAIAIARELKKEGLSVEFITKTTKLSTEEIEKL